MSVASTTGYVTARAAAAARISGAAAPIRTMPLHVPSSASSIGAYEPPLSTPPAISTSGRGNPRTEAATDATFVPLLSS